MQTLRDLFRDHPALDSFLSEMAQKVTEGIGVPISQKVATHVEPVDVQLSSLFLRQTIDNLQSRNQLIKRVANEVQNRLGLRLIEELSTEGIKLEAQYDTTIVGYHLVAQIWY